MEDRLEVFPWLNHREVNHEPIFRGRRHRAGNRFRGVNVCIGISLRGPQWQWSNGLGQPAPACQGSGRRHARMHRRGRKSPRALLSHRLLPVK